MREGSITAGTTASIPTKSGANRGRSLLSTIAALEIKMSIFYLINLFNFMLGCGLPTHIKAIFDLIDLTKFVAYTEPPQKMYGGIRIFLQCRVPPTDCVPGLPTTAPSHTTHTRR